MLLERRLLDRRRGQGLSSEYEGKKSYILLIIIANTIAVVNFFIPVSPLFHVESFALINVRAPDCFKFPTSRHNFGVEKRHG